MPARSSGSLLGRLLVLAALLAAHAAAGAQSAEALLPGVWLTEGGQGRIELFRGEDGLYAGRVVSGSEEGLKDAHNPDPALRNRPVKGLVILSGFRFEGGGRFVDGRIYDPSSGNTYRARLTLIDRDTLRLRGYIGIPLLGGSQTWTREGAQSAPGGQPD